jgi:hypothetical protein
MQGTPGVTTFKHNGRDQIYAFVHGDDGLLHSCFWNAAPNITSWQWDNRGRPLDARVNSSPTTTPSTRDFGPGSFLHVFVTGNDGHLYEHFWNGFQWVDWVDHGQPVWNTTMAMSPGVTTFRRKSGEGEDALFDAADILLIFVWGSDDLLYLFRHVDSSWRFQGPLPHPQAVVASEPAVIKHFHQGIPDIYAYVVGSDGHLYVNHSTDWQALNWMWRDLGQPDASTGVTWNVKPGLVSFQHAAENRIYAFVRGSDGHLWVHFWRDWRQPGTGTWADLGTPEGATVFSEPSVVTFRFENTDRIYAFVHGSDNHLHVCYWNGVDRWLWNDFGRPSTGEHDVAASPGAGNTAVSSAPGVVTFRFVEPHQTTDRIYAFVRGSDNHLHQCYWNGVDVWLWNDLGTPTVQAATIRGDYRVDGVRSPNGRADIPLLISKLNEIGAGHFMQLIWSQAHSVSPHGWEDFQLMAPEFQANQLNLWAYLVPPSELPAPDPFGHDYIRWAEEIATIARVCPVVQGMVIDDFNGNTNLFTVDYVNQILAAARAIHPDFQFFATSYYGYTQSFQHHVVQGVLDGLVFAYFYPHKDHRTTATLRPQIEELRTWLDTASPRKHVKLVVMVYATKHSQAPEEPTPAYVKSCLEIARQAAWEGVTNGAVTYVLQKANQSYLDAVKDVYLQWQP